MRRIVLFVLAVFAFSFSYAEEGVCSVADSEVRHIAALQQFPKAWAGDGMSFRQSSETQYVEIDLMNSQCDTIVLKYNFKDREFKARPILRLEFFPKDKFKFWRVNVNKVSPAKLTRTSCLDDREVTIDTDISQIRFNLKYNVKTLKAKVSISYKDEMFYCNDFVVRENPDEYFDKFFEGALRLGYLVSL